jgi:anti-sigma regulatory factor (Ser/Thr protein kinase)
MRSVLNVQLPPSTDAAWIARSALRKHRAAFGDRLAVLELLVTELVTNCVLHAGLDPSSNVDVSVSGEDEVLHVEVRDPGARYDDAVEAWGGLATDGGRSEHTSDDAGDDAGGLGLRVVSTLAHRSGVRWDDGTVAWFDV